MVYISGGFTGQECLQTAEYYDPQTNQWTLIAPMRHRRSGVSIIAHDGFVYAIGGFNGSARLTKGEKYNPSNNTWKSIAEMDSPRSNYAIEVSSTVILITGHGPVCFPRPISRRH